MKTQFDSNTNPATRHRKLLPIILVALFVNAGLLHAQTGWSLTRARVVTGGGTCTNGTITLRATIGQPDASAPLTGGGYSLTGGFWAGAAVVQTPGAPLLSIICSGNNVVLAWAGPATGYGLQECTNLSGGNWTDVNAAPVDNGGNRSVTLPIAPGNRFFRLKK